MIHTWESHDGITYEVTHDGGLRVIIGPNQYGSVAPVLTAEILRLSDDLCCAQDVVQAHQAQADGVRSGLVYVLVELGVSEEETVGMTAEEMVFRITTLLNKIGPREEENLENLKGRVTGRKKRKK